MRSKMCSVSHHSRLPLFNTIRKYTTDSQASFDYCQQLVKTADYESYLWGLFIPQQLRQVHWAVRAFNIETARIRENVTQIALGKLRTTWWREGIRQVFEGQCPSHPVLTAIGEGLKRCTISQHWFKRVIDEREANLESHHYTTIKEVEDYSENTASSLLYISLESLGIKDIQADHAASHLGKAVGIVTLLRATPLHIRKRMLYLPSEVIAKYRISQEALFRGDFSKNFQDVVFDIATIANHHLTKARALRSSLPPQSYLSLLSAVACDHFLQNLERFDFNLFEPRLHSRDYRLPFKFWKAANKREY